MTEVVTIATEREALTLVQLTIDDAPAYFDAVDNNRAHLSQFGDNTAAKYPDLTTVQESIEHPANPDKLRFGMWDDNCFVGSINLTPDETFEAEIGYWVDGRYTGRGFATFATRALAKYAQERYERVVAVVHTDNSYSQRVLTKAGFWSVDKIADKLIYELMIGRVPNHIPESKTQHFERGGFSGDIYVPKTAEMGFTALEVDVHGAHPRKRILEGNTRSYYVVDGTGSININGSTFLMSKGKLFVIQPGDEYSYSGEMKLFEFNVSPDNSFKDETL